jgi:hypothetical protein
MFFIAPTMFFMVWQLPHLCRVCLSILIALTLAQQNIILFGKPE